VRYENLENYQFNSQVASRGNWLPFILAALTLLLGRQEGHLAHKKYGGMVEVGTGWSGWSGTQPDGQCVCLC